MIVFLRFVGLMNAAVWLGAAVFFILGAGPAFSSEDMRRLLGEKNYPFFSEAIAQVVIARYFKLQLICSIVALLHAVAEWLYLGRPLRRWNVGLLVGLLVLALAGGVWLQPRIRSLHASKFAVNQPPAVRQASAQSLRIWHGAAQCVNLLMVAGVAIYFWRLSHSVSTAHYLRP